MPSPTTLLGKVSTPQNLYKAWLDISRHVSDNSHGMSDQTIEEFRANLKSNLKFIRQELLSGTYDFGPKRAVVKQKKSGGKRPLVITDVRDRVVQRAITRKLENILGSKFKLDNPASFAYLPKKRGRPAKGVQSAIKQMLRYHQEGCNYVFEADIVKFFDKVDHTQLLEHMIYPNLPDRTIDDLIKKIFEVEIGNRDDLPEDDWKLYPDGSMGLPQGGYLSPLFSNVYLSDFDREMLKADFRLIRYADDFIVMCKFKAEAESAYELAKSLVEKMKLQLHPRNDNDKKAKTRIIRLRKNKITFLGVEFNGIYIVPDHEKKVELSNKLWKIRKKSRNVLELLTSTKNLLDGWVASYAFTNIDQKYLESLDKEVNTTLWSALYTFGWRLMPRDFLSSKQREYSGVNPVVLHRDTIRYSFKREDRELLMKYWSKE
jgi:RNA-directed DNA polymerase